MTSTDFSHVTAIEVTSDAEDPFVEVRQVLEEIPAEGGPRGRMLIDLTEPGMATVQTGEQVIDVARPLEIEDA